MIEIFNRKEDRRIMIDDSLPQVIFMPKDYEDVPHVIIELRGLNFHTHSLTCKDCKSFINSFGTRNMDWFISYSGKVKRLDLLRFENQFLDNHSTFKISEFENGSLLKINLSTLPSDKEELQALLQANSVLENFEYCSLLQNLINET